MFRPADILICEDDPLIGLDLSISVEAAGGHVIGPIASVTEAMALLDTRSVDAALLDVILKDGEVTPVALRLLAWNVPVVVQSGVGLPSDLKEMVLVLPLFLKPVRPAILIQSLAERIGRI